MTRMYEPSAPRLSHEFGNEDGRPMVMVAGNPGERNRTEDEVAWERKKTVMKFVSFTILASLIVTLSFLLKTEIPKIMCRYNFNHPTDSESETQSDSSCYFDSNCLQVTCYGSNVSQNNLDEFFTNFRSKYNKHSGNPNPNGWISLSSFTLSRTQLETLDLSSLSRLKFEDSLSIINNVKLKSLTMNNIESSTLKSKTVFKNDKDCRTGEIDVTTLDLSNNALENDGLANFLPHFCPIKVLRLSGNNIRGSRPESKDFIPGLSLQPSLEDLHLDHNDITNLSNGPFYENTRLRHLRLSYNQLGKVGPHAFVFREVPWDLQAAQTALHLDLTNNYLTRFGDGTEHGLHTLNLRPVEILLDFNRFETVSQANFLHFLENKKSGTNKTIDSLRFYGNSFVCDDSMKWLKVRKAELEPIVQGVDCTNDPGKTVFDTDVISRAAQLIWASNKNYLVIILAVITLTFTLK